MVSFIRRRKLLVAGVAGFVTLAAGLAAVAFVVHANQTTIDPIEHAKLLIESDNPAAALEVLQAADSPSDEMIALEVTATANRRDVFGLASLYDLHPEAVTEQDHAAQIVGRTAMIAGDGDAVDELVARWESDSSQPHAWLCLKADRLLREGKGEEARDLLDSVAFDGAQDGGRQLRLAMIDAATDSIAALDRINRFLEAAPRHSDAHLMRGQLLEGIGRLPEARVSYVTAAAASPSNPFYRYELASFYRRTGELRFAIQTWQDSTALPSPAPGWLKTSFWSRVAYPAESELGDTALDGRIGELATFIAGLPDDRFFDGDAFAMLESARPLERQYQEIYWLRLFEALRVGEELDALRMLRANRFADQSWNIVLEASLESLLELRTGGMLKARTPRSFGSLAPAAVHPFIAALQPEKPRDVGTGFAEFLKSDNAIAMTLLAAGWMEAALRMPHDRVCPNEAPHHMAYAMTQAYRSNRTSEVAFDFAKHQPASPALDSLLGELYLARGKPDEAIQMWRIAARNDGPAGYRASWLLGTRLLEEGRLDEAARTVNRHPLLRPSVIGQELLARIARQQGELERAIAIYNSIGTESIDARLFAIERHIARGGDEDLDEAAAIGDQLIAVHPDVPSVRRLVLELSDLRRQRDRATAVN